MTQNVNASKKNASKKAKAILAGGLVLGVGAVVTLASWTDQEWANASFASGDFVLESSTDGADFTSHASVDESAQLQFDMPTATNLSPGQKLVAPFALRLDTETTYDANVTVEAPTANGDIEGLTYGFAPVNSAADCNTEAKLAAAFAPEFKLEAGEGHAPGDAQILCFYVSTSEALEQGESVKPTWTFHATSVDSAN